VDINGNTKIRKVLKNHLDYVYNEIDKEKSPCRQ
jgi:hypothetical protein